MSNTQEGKEYTTSSMECAAALMMHSVPCLRMDIQDSPKSKLGRRAIFVFDHVLAYSCQNAFWDGTLELPCKAFGDKIKECKRLVHQAIENEPRG